MGDAEKNNIKNKIFDLVSEAHILMLQHNTNISAGAYQQAGILAQFCRSLMSQRSGDISNNANIARQRNEDAAKANGKPISLAKNRGVHVKVETEASEKGMLIEQAKDLGIKVDARMSVETIQAKIAEHGA